MKKKIATKKGETRIEKATTKYILEQFWLERRRQIDIWKDISDRCSIGYVRNVIRFPLSYVTQEFFRKLTIRYEKRLYKGGGLIST